MDRKIEYDENYFKNKWGNILSLEIKRNNGGTYNIKTFFERILKDVYGPLGLYRKGNWKYVKGVYNTGYKDDDRYRSNVNFINTNYTVFRYLINTLNEKIYNGEFENYSQIDFKNNDWNKELKKFFIIMYKNKEKIFNSKSSILRDIILIIKRTKKIGEQAENITVEKISKNPGVSNAYKSKEWGLKQDMIKGVDVTFKYKNRERTIQVKSFKRLIKEGDEYIIKDATNPKEYNVDIFSFYNRHTEEFYMFKNEGVSINGSDMIIKQDKLIDYRLQGL